MSYYCTIDHVNGFSEISTELKLDLLDIYEKQDICYEDVLSDEDKESFNLSLSYIDNPTGAIFDWANKHKLTFSFLFIGEDDDVFDENYVNGKRIN